jgi:voltage-gated potassium channel
MKWIKDNIRFSQLVLRIIKSKTFFHLTILGNSLIFSTSALFYYLERNINPSITTYLDCLWWGFATATTVGYGDVTPKTNMGKILGICLMLVGTAIFAMYTALFAQTIIEEEFSDRNK